MQANNYSICYFKVGIILKLKVRQNTMVVAVLRNILINRFSIHGAYFDPISIVAGAACTVKCIYYCPNIICHYAALQGLLGSYY